MSVSAICLWLLFICLLNDTYDSTGNMSLLLFVKSIFFYQNNLFRLFDDYRIAAASFIHVWIILERFIHAQLLQVDQWQAFIAPGLVQLRIQDFRGAPTLIVSGIFPQNCMYFRFGTGDYSSEQVWTCLQSWPPDVTSREGGTGLGTDGSMYNMVGKRILYNEVQGIMSNGHMGPPLKILPSRNLVGRR